MKVAIVHDYLTQRGGAERVVLAMARTFPDAAIHTTLYDANGTYPEFRDLDVRVTPINRVPVFRVWHRTALPLLPWAMKQVDVGDADVVVASSSGWAHGVQAEVPVVVYCHNPPRWLHQPEDYTRDLAWPKRVALRMLHRKLAQWDHWAAGRAHRYVVNSRAVRDRVLSVYGRDSDVLPPPLGLDPDGPQSAVPGLEPGFLLTVGRLRGYKDTQVIADAVRLLPDEQLVIVGGTPPGADRDHNVKAFERIGDEQLRWLYANAGALVAMSHEDFGLTPPEANSLGVPSLVLRAGGYLDTTTEGVNGLFVDESSAVAVADGITRIRAANFDRDAVRRHAAQFDEISFSRRLAEIVAEAYHSTRPHVRV